MFYFRPSRQATSWRQSAGHDSLLRQRQKCNAWDVRGTGHMAGCDDRRKSGKGGKERRARYRFGHQHVRLWFGGRAGGFRGFGLVIERRRRKCAERSATFVEGFFASLCVEIKRVLFSFYVLPVVRRSRAPRRTLSFRFSRMRMRRAAMQRRQALPMMQMFVALHSKPSQTVKR